MARILYRPCSFYGWLSRRWGFRFNGLLTPFLPFPLSSLRTSETNYLNEAFSFYAAIRGRAYYSRAAREERWVTHHSEQLMCLLLSLLEAAGMPLHTLFSHWHELRTTDYVCTKVSLY